MNSIVKTAQCETPAFGAFDRFLRGRLLDRMAALRHGELLLEDACGAVALGEAAAAHTDLRIHVQVLDPAFYRYVAANGSVGAGEAWMDGLWRCDNLVGLIQLLVRNRDLLDGMETGFARVGGWAMRLWHELRRNTRAGSRRNIAEHYDLGNEFFGLFLSKDLMYSSAVWTEIGRAHV
jgi:cyclopropane-fatty-acyl-phospholipid synthase